jgi:hypothetical protein
MELSPLIYIKKESIVLLERSARRRNRSAWNPDWLGTTTAISALIWLQLPDSYLKEIQRSSLILEALDDLSKMSFFSKTNKSSKILSLIV